MLSVSPGFLPESRAETDPSANNGPGTFNKFLDHAPLIGVPDIRIECSWQFPPQAGTPIRSPTAAASTRSQRSFAGRIPGALMLKILMPAS